MTEECITPLRRRMIEDMSVRHFASKTQHDYIRTVMKLTRFLGRSPDTATNEDLRRFQLHLTENRAGAPIINSTVSALRFFFTVTLGRADAARHLTFVHEPRKLPVVLSPEEVARLLEAAPGVKYKAALSVAYGAGLRVSEVVSLKVSAIDSKRMMLRVEQGKGRKDRHAMLSPVLLELLRDWYRIARPQGWLFPGQNPITPMSTRQLTRACHAAAQMAEIAKRVSPHTLRHSFATHLLEQNIDIHVSLGQLKVMAAIESCRTAALGGHVARCEDCAHEVIAYNSCRNRHCPKCQGAAARRWLREGGAELLPTPYYRLVFTLPAAIGDIAYHNKTMIYGLLFKA